MRERVKDLDLFLYFSKYGKVVDVKQTEDKFGDKTGQGYVKFYDKKSVDKVFDMGRTHRVLECQFQISRRKISLSGNMIYNGSLTLFIIDMPFRF